MPDPPALADVRHGWAWTVLPSRCRRVRALGEEGLAASLRGAGLEVVPADHVGAGDLPVLATFARWPARGDVGSLVPSTGAPRLVAVAVIPERNALVRRSRPRRVLARLESGPAALLAGLRGRRLVGALRRSGLDAWRAPIGETAGGVALGAGSPMFNRRGRATGALVVGTDGRAPGSILDEACDEARRAVGAELRRGATTLLRTGAVMAELVDPGGARYLLRVAGGTAGELLRVSTHNRERLLAAGPPASVRARVPQPLGSGRVGVAAWALEAKVAGGPPGWMTAELWDECTAFLVGLHLSSGWREPRAADAPEWDLGREFRAIEQHARPEARATLTLLEEALWERLAGVPRGWGHGDFWTANLLVAGNRLGTVVDWDSAAANAPPALDLMHLLLLSSRRARRLPHGSRCTQVLLPLARRGGDERLRGYCAATGSRSDSGTLEALALAYWASRVGRDLRVYRDRPGRPRWMNDNLHRPLSELQPAAL